MPRVSLSTAYIRVVSKWLGNHWTELESFPSAQYVIWCAWKHHLELFCVCVFVFSVEFGPYILATSFLCFSWKSLGEEKKKSVLYKSRVYSTKIKCLCFQSMKHQYPLTILYGQYQLLTVQEATPFCCHPVILLFKMRSNLITSKPAIL